MKKKAETNETVNDVIVSIQDYFDNPLLEEDKLPEGMKADVANLIARLQKANNLNKDSVQDDLFSIATKETPNVETGNIGQLRKALQAVKELYVAWASSKEDANVFLMTACNVATEALDAPARNCDLYTNCEEAFAAYATSSELIGYDNWLFAEVKGDKND